MRGDKVVHLVHREDGRRVGALMVAASVALVELDAVPRDVAVLGVEVVLAVAEVATDGLRIS